MTIAAALAELRASRKLKWHGDHWSILSTDGHERRYVRWDEDRQDLACTCPAGDFPRYCWHRTRVADWLMAKFGKMHGVRIEPPPSGEEAKPVSPPDPDLNIGHGWRNAWLESQQRREA